MSHSIRILSEMCIHYYVKTSQMIVQKLPFPTTNKPNVHVIRRYHKHLHDGTKSDAVTTVASLIFSFSVIFEQPTFCL
jgi:hypothetical protein